MGQRFFLISFLLTLKIFGAVQEIRNSATLRSFISQGQKKGQPSLVVLTWTFCPPCQRLSPILHELENEGKFQVAKIIKENWEESIYPFDQDFDNVPKLLFVGSNGMVNGSLIGFQEKPIILEAMAPFLMQEGSRTNPIQIDGSGSAINPIVVGRSNTTKIQICNYS